jgi:GNAT superfamily N-acetyltransferase
MIHFAHYYKMVEYCVSHRNYIESLIIMTERAPRRENADHGFEISRITSEEELIRYIDFMTRIFSNLPDYYSKEVKDRLSASVALEHTLPLLDNPDFQMYQAKDASGTAGRIIGFGNGRMKSYDDLGLPRMGYIAWMGVDESARGTGVASKIIGALEDGFREHAASRAVCFIKDLNIASIKRFSREGYQEYDRIPSTYDGTQGRFYSKPLVQL